jgi:hypothetical protein
LAIAYTGAAIGMDIAIARILLSIIFGIGIGVLMAKLFHKETHEVDESMFMDDAKVRPAIWVFFALMILLLVAGTLQVDFLTKAFLMIDIFQGKLVGLNSDLESLGLNIQGALIIGFLSLTGLFAWKGFEREAKPINGWNSIAIGLVLMTLLIASPKVSDSPGMVINITGRAIAITILLGSLILVARLGLSKDEIGNWLWETWKFVS